MLKIIDAFARVTGYGALVAGLAWDLAPVLLIMFGIGAALGLAFGMSPVPA